MTGDCWTVLDWSPRLTGRRTGATGFGRIDATFSTTGEATNSESDIDPSSSRSAES